MVSRSISAGLLPSLRTLDSTSLKPPFFETLVRSLAKGLVPSNTYIAYFPDDMLALQELHLAGEGVETELICPDGQKSGNLLIQVVITAKALSYCNSRPAVTCALLLSAMLLMMLKSTSSHAFKVPTRREFTPICARTSSFRLQWSRLHTLIEPTRMGLSKSC